MKLKMLNIVDAFFALINTVFNIHYKKEEIKRNKIKFLSVKKYNKI